MKVILGIDPGSVFTGFGVVHLHASERKESTRAGRDVSAIIHVTHGVISPPANLTFPERIGIISREIEKLIHRVKPDITVIERVFLGKNADSAFKLGHARGVIMAAAVRGDSEIIEYAARAVKKSITGSGAATKEQVQTVLFATLGITKAARADASDALALAFMHARALEVEQALKQGHLLKMPTPKREIEL